MQKTAKIVTIFGGSGFVGRYVVKELARAGYRIRIVSRDSVKAGFLKTQGEVGQINCVHGDMTDDASLPELIKGSDAVINLVGILFEKGKQRFSTLHAESAGKLAEAAKVAGVAAFVQMSALGVDKATTSTYAKTKLAGEKAVLAAFPQAVIIRPSVIFGPEDNFFNQFACMSRFLPFLPLIGGGKTKFQPVYVGDVAKIFALALNHPEMQGNIYELGGPEVLSFEEILNTVRKITKRDPYLLPIPSVLASAGAMFAQFLPVPPLTPDQVELLKYDNVVDESAHGFRELDIVPKFIADIVPGYLSRYAREEQHVIHANP